MSINRFNRDETQNQWLDMVIADFGGWWGFVMGTLILLIGAVQGFVVFLVAGPILLIGAVLLAVVGWFKNK